jgi:hypothetical protein
MKLSKLWKTKTEKKKYLDALINEDSVVPKVYNMKNDHEIGEFISHPKFGLGFIEKMVGQKKVLVFFEESEKTLLQNWASS